MQNGYSNELIPEILRLAPKWAVDPEGKQKC
jgi:hypothetical protein